jgi:hypothetical protein
MPLFEAIVNSIHAIEEAGRPMEQGQIRVEILRDQSQKALSAGKKGGGLLDADSARSMGNIRGFRITDNGIGFDAKNMESFATLDSDHKIARGGRGIGRLFWLLAFKTVEIKSVFRDKEQGLTQRHFIFSKEREVSGDTQESVESAETWTTVEMDGFIDKYRERAPKTGKAVAKAIFEHCFWYFLRPSGAPNMFVEDGGDIFPMTDEYREHMHSSTSTERIKIRDKDFEIIHVKMRTDALQSPTMVFCADQRVVKEEKLQGKIAGLHGRMPDGDGDFVYSCFVSSAFLDERADQARTDFDIMEEVPDLFAFSEMGFKDIRDAVFERIRAYLHDHLAINIEKSKARVTGFVAGSAPRYRPILSRIPEDQLYVDPEIADKDLDITLHKHFATLEAELLDEGHTIMESSAMGADYDKRLSDYLSKAEDIKKSDLAGYVSRRRVILDLFGKAIQRKPDGSYAREEDIHQLIMPMREDSDTVQIDSGNLWLVDERLIFHEYLASDKQIRSYPITGASETTRPDICGLKVFDVPQLFSESSKMPSASLVIIEIKRPMKKEAKAGEKDDPIEQAMGYLKQIREGGITSATGRPIHRSEKTPGFLYILADLTPELVERCEFHDLTRTADGDGYFGHKTNYSAYIEVISFDRLLQMAKERNRAFFDRLALPAN